MLYLMKLTNVNGDDYEIHKNVMSYFPKNCKGEKIRFQTRGGYVTVISTIKPNDHEYEIVDSEINKNDKHFFTLRVYPFEKINDKRVLAKDCRGWIMRMAKKSGFSIIDCKIEKEGCRIHIKRKKENAVPSVYVTGMLNIDDDKKFLNCLKSGIGPQKYLGYGLVNIW